jgi:F-type H+-transporting ATPase subunit b
VELNWSTFVLEIINFLVLVWILKRFLYQPVLDVIARRREGIEQRLSDAEAVHAEAEALQAQYEGRLSDWERERQAARESLAAEIDAERERRLSELVSSLEQAREKASAGEARRAEQALGKMEESALAQGARFATRVLEQAAGPELEARLIELLISELPDLPPEQAEKLHNHIRGNAESVVVTSAYPLAEEQRRRLEQAIQAVTGPDRGVRFEQDDELIAGARVTIGAWVLAANVREELRGFTELAQDA